MGDYSLKSPSPALFAHFDKTVYANSENVWFTAYLLNCDKTKNNPSILSALLVNDHDKSIVFDRKYVMAEGLSFGNVFLADSIPPGDFTFILYTNQLINGKPADVFEQPVTIKDAVVPGFKITLNLVDTGKTVAGHQKKILLQVQTMDGQPVIGAMVSYLLSGKVPSIVKTDALGQYLFSIPGNESVPGNNFLNVSVVYKKEVKTLRMFLPPERKQFKVGFYPEGGSLVQQERCVLGWEVKQYDGRPLKVQGVLYQDKQILDTIETDSYGMGYFKLFPLAGHNYKVKLLGDATDSIYLLPPVLQNGPVININKAVCTDSLHLRLFSKYPGKYLVVIHNFKSLFYAFPVTVSVGVKNVVINLKDAPKGLNALTVLDDQQRPVAERVFFAHYDHRTPLEINTDQPVYTTRQEVHLKLKLDAADSVKGVASVACVQSSRMEIKKANDIESFVYLRNELAAIPVKEKYMGESEEDKDYLENVLLIKGWRKYKWQDLAKTNVNNTLANRSLIKLAGDVNRYGKKLKKPEHLMITTDSSSNFIDTDPGGHFILPDNTITTATDKKAYILLTNSNKYGIVISRNFDAINDSLVKKWQPANYIFASQNVLNTDAQTLAGLQHTIGLKTVVIKGKREDDNSPLSGRLSRENECGDYVCRFNVLNCQNHRDEPDNRPAVHGERYHVAGGPDITYDGCTAGPPSVGAIMLKIDGINYSKDFYGSDYSQFNPPGPDYESTIYWKHLCFVNAKKEVDLSFYTSDITGRFKVIVQGITNSDVIYGEKEFTVKKQ